MQDPHIINYNILLKGIKQDLNKYSLMSPKSQNAEDINFPKIDL